MVAGLVRVDQQQWRLTTSRALSIYLIPRSVSFLSLFLPRGRRASLFFLARVRLYFCIRPRFRSRRCGFAPQYFIRDPVTFAPRVKAGEHCAPAIRNKYI